MNLYLRYFDREVFVSNADQAIDFLKSIPEISVDADLEADIREYAASDVCYPKRYKVRPAFILLLSRLLLPICRISRIRKLFVLLP